MSSEVNNTRVPAVHCPYCGLKLDCASGVGPPQPGRITLCIRCAGVMEFTSDLRLRKIADADVPLEARVAVEFYRVAIRQAWARRRAAMN